MGFLSRIISSLGSKKSRRKRAEIARNNGWVDEVGAQTDQPVNSDEANEIAANLLLRSSSARYAVVAETDYTSLPPLPHPINSALSTPSESTTSLPSVSRRGTYVVKVYPRQKHTSTDLLEVDNEPQTPQPRRRAQTVGDDSTHLQGLRRDPSVASLLDLYDEHGHLPSKAFSNTPPREGRAQTQRTGSTLRELLGDPSHRHNASSLEGDISWAERFLGEANSAASSVSSLALQTPDTSDSLFSNSHLSSNAHHESTFLTSDNDLSSSFLDNPIISSMEVELSEITESSQVIDSPYVTEDPQLNQDPKTPRRASEVFGFLTEKRKSRAPEDTLDRSLPGPPSAFSLPSEGPALSRFSLDTLCDSHNTVAISPSSDTRSCESRENHPDSIFDDSFASYDIPQQQPASWTDLHLNHADWAITSDDNPTVEDAQVARKVKVILTAPTKVIVTAPTPLADTTDRPTATRIPRGPRSLHRPRSRSLTKDQRPGLIERSNSSDRSDPFAPVPSRPMKLQRRSSTSLNDHADIHVHISRPLEKQSSGSSSKSRRLGSTRSLMSGLFDKENTNTLSSLSATAELPMTPIRSNSSSSRSLLRSAITPASFRPPEGMTPSPASSSELSPVGKMMMLDVRRQRSKTRESQKGGGGGRRHGSERVI
ncbi:hypothetical protein BT96DRAFT_1019458 [Gymnopus androsaceus JB14]|uniref:Uncharacterized protein n=1 Tax=Gymnopus androsaceus JB14 TaxID=1447944 RepID=A0A6A4HNH8_9AGAR|nr:hypothetical protein BT96DRAFT_1019458 [Gymnopus androsaceus JB14]